MNVLNKILSLLDTEEQSQAKRLVGIILIMALLDTLGIASILPFVAVLANPVVLTNNPALSWAFSASQTIGVGDSTEFLILLGILFFFILIFSIVFKGYVTYAQLKFTMFREYTISIRLIENYLKMPYEWHLGRNSSDLGKNILSEVSNVVVNALMAAMTIISQCAVVVAIVTVLIYVDPILALSIATFMGVFYILIITTTSGLISRIGSERVNANKMRFTAVNEAFGAIKEVNVFAAHSEFVKRFDLPAKNYAYNTALSLVVAQIPRFVLEGVAFGGMLLIIVVFMIRNSDFSDALPVFSLYAFAGYRLMPALQQLYGAISQLRFVTPALDLLCKDIDESGAYEMPNNERVANFVGEIKFNDVSYRYPNAQLPSISDINLIIPTKSTVALVGKTGSGKSTVVDLILGLFEPEKGAIYLDGINIKEFNRQSYLKKIGYVPQNIYLTDDTIAANIAFGIEPNHIDQEMVVQASKLANLDEFVINKLPDGYQTVVGERGARLSGGQKQRIGIARALYNNPELLILDEATSALDSLTEQVVMDAVHNLSHKITIIIIAHRLSTIEYCDIIHVLENGKIIESGSYDQLIQMNKMFSQFVAVS